MAAKRCAYQHGDERCSKYALGTSEFCTKHSHALPAPEAAEANAFGAATARALRAELGVDRDDDDRPGAAPAPEEDDLPEAAKADPLRYAMNLALEAVAEAYAADHEERGNARRPGPRQSPTDRARQSLAAYMPELDDPAAMVGERSGKSLVKKGWIGRWVRDKDEDGRPNSRRLRMFYAQGAEDVLDDDGRPLVGRLGRAIQMPPTLYAARVLRHSPSGAFDSSPTVQNVLEMAESVNRQAGRRVVDVRPAAEHGSRRGGDW